MSRSTLLLYNRFAVIITLVYVWIPFVALPILAALQRIDRNPSKPRPTSAPTLARASGGSPCR